MKENELLILTNSPNLKKADGCVYFFLHIDADPDNSFACKVGRRSVYGDSSLRWNGLLSTLSFLENLGEKLKDFGLSFKSTIFLRADEQIKELYGTFSEVFLRFHDSIEKSFCVGWHPHLYRWSNRHQCWHQEWRDDQWMLEVLTDCYEDLISHGFEVPFSKMGWCFHNNSTMKTLSELGIKADFSALPGARNPGRLIKGVSLQDVFDWSRTGRQPYHPSEQDYQKQGNLKMLEIPLTTFQIRHPTIFPYTLKLAFKSYWRFRSFSAPSFHLWAPLTFLNLARQQDTHRIFEPILKQNKPVYITMYFHPHELTDIYKRDALERSIFELASITDKHGLKLSFVDATELYSLIGYSSKGCGNHFLVS